MSGPKKRFEKKNITDDLLSKESLDKYEKKEKEREKQRQIELRERKYRTEVSRDLVPCLRIVHYLLQQNESLPFSIDRKNEENWKQAIKRPINLCDIRDRLMGAFFLFLFLCVFVLVSFVCIGLNSRCPCVRTFYFVL